ncbi:YceI family protein [Flagellimonas sp. HMM57]|uniref:YceI family protein n=1 Tax=unclassified Flagellimonas TaxID=2644544 RepID=UPI0013D35B06|nr:MULTISPECIES: YceI family protein [unclassified Flagellimonas]UII77308.1 YceI family protein [Flagellimonas sp. HMM57]
MNKFFTLFFVLLFYCGFSQNTSKYISRQGHVSFFSYTSVENIEAENNQVLSIFDTTNGEIAISMLMRAFVFKKALMQEHFNESYIETDIYPKAVFEGVITDLEVPIPEQTTKIVKGALTLHGITKELEIKTKMERTNDLPVFSGSFEVLVSDFKIKIPPVVAGNIAKRIEVQFRFEYQPYEN